MGVERNPRPRSPNADLGEFPAPARLQGQADRQDNRAVVGARARALAGAG